MGILSPYMFYMILSHMALHPKELEEHVKYLTGLMHIKIVICFYENYERIFNPFMNFFLNLIVAFTTIIHV